jgi:hypothetical protein
MSRSGSEPSRGCACVSHRQRYTASVEHFSSTTPWVIHRSSKNSVGLTAALLLAKLVGPPPLGAASLRQKVHRVLERVERSPRSRARRLGVADGERLGDRAVPSPVPAELHPRWQRATGHRPPPDRGGSGNRPFDAGRRRVFRRTGRTTSGTGGRSRGNSGTASTVTRRDLHHAAASTARIRSPHARLAGRSPRLTARRTDRASTRSRTATSCAVRTADGSRSSNEVVGSADTRHKTEGSEALSCQPRNHPLRISIWEGVHCGAPVEV